MKALSASAEFQKAFLHRGAAQGLNSASLCGIETDICCCTRQRKPFKSTKTQIFVRKWLLQLTVAKLNNASMHAKITLCLRHDNDQKSGTQYQPAVKCCRCFIAISKSEKLTSSAQGEVNWQSLSARWEVNTDLRSAESIILTSRCRWWVLITLHNKERRGRS